MATSLARLALLGALVLAGCDAGSAEPLVVHAVRHAEKAGAPEGDPPLTPAGTARAQALARQMAAVELAAIYATPYRRTRDTVIPTARAHGLDPDDIRTDLPPTGPLAAHILAEHPGETVLVCGHSNTVPALLEALGAGGPAASLEAASHKIGHDDYGDLWTLTRSEGEVTVEKSRFGDP